MIKLQWKDRLLSIGKLHLHSDLSGKCWTGEFYVDVPRRFYVNYGDQNKMRGFFVSPFGDDGWNIIR